MRSNEMETAFRLITEFFTFLETTGFKTEITREEDHFFLENAEIKYTNETTARQVRIFYLKSNTSQDIKYTFSGSVIRLPYKTPYKDYFSFSEYFNSLGTGFNGSLTNTFDEQEAKLILQELAGFVQKNAAIFIEGKQWIEGYYPKW